MHTLVCTHTRTQTKFTCIKGCVSTQAHVHRYRRAHVNMREDVRAQAHHVTGFTVMQIIPSFLPLKPLKPQEWQASCGQHPKIGIISVIAICTLHTVRTPAQNFSCRLLRQMLCRTLRGLDLPRAKKLTLSLHAVHNYTHYYLLTTCPDV